jgi:hypothetical protein
MPPPKKLLDPLPPGRHGNQLTFRGMSKAAI